MATEVVMPRLGEGVIEGTIARWLKKEGEAVAQYEPLLEIETDKVTTEATAEEAGTLLKILFAEGDTVPVDSVIAYIGQAGEKIAPPDGNGSVRPPQAAPQPGPAPAQAGPPTAPANREGLGRISPVVARIAAEHSVDLQQVSGTGRGGRITKKDILAFIEQKQSAPVPVAPAPAPAAAPFAPAPAAAAPSGAGELVPLTNMRRAIAAHMAESKRTSPHVTTVFEADFTRIAAHRRAHKDAYERDGVRLTFTPYLVSAIAQALEGKPGGQQQLDGRRHFPQAGNQHRHGHSAGAGAYCAGDSRRGRPQSARIGAHH